jgi:aminoglycoside/choline kinase family phosphotransferase
MPWALTVLAPADTATLPVLELVAGDASPRRYFRLTLGAATYIVVEAPPATEKNPEFLQLRDLLSAAGVRVPGIYGSDLERGYLLLEDLGDRQLLAELSTATVPQQYRSAMAVLEQLACIDTRQLADLPVYDSTLLAEELSRFPQWFVEILLGHVLSAREHAIIADLSTRLVSSALEQPRVLVHRDFHSRNLMPQADGTLAVIDFQDAVVGPVTYDLVSLLRDCYISWPQEQIQLWALDHRARLQAAGLLGEVEAQNFLRWFDLMGLQRHIKVLGTFARLYLRDGKPGYLADLPLVIHYVLTVTAKYSADEPELAAFHRWFETVLSPLVARQEWGGEA